ncbi:hypothetical protein [Egbenema bharatensis]|uniref:hypothetical protein n=1 Tax=Egbenema bharatensis TaxID=3463334 RepID=UPI003A8557B5
MENLLELINPQTVLLIAAIVVSLLVLRLLFKILTSGFGIILAIAVVVLGVNYFFNITPGQLWTEVGHLPQDFFRLVQNVQLPELGTVLLGL